MLFHILPTLIDGPYGGGNQFAKALRLCFLRNNHYADNIDDATILLFNGYPFRDLESFSRACKWKQQKPESRLIITRLDGPIARGRHNPQADSFDCILYEFSDMVSDGIVIQSHWSYEQMSLHPLAPKCPSVVIGNAPNPNIFYPPQKSISCNGKIKVISSSWSANPHKGFDTYLWLDKNIDFGKFEFSIVAPTNYKYDNIRVLAPVNQEALASLLRESDAYITASRIESCSNAALEALHCGLPVIAPNDSSHPEFMPSGELLFNAKEDIPKILESLSDNLEKYKKDIVVASIDDIARQYIEFARELFLTPPKRISTSDLKLFLLDNNLSVNVFHIMKKTIKQQIKNAISRR
ncbi:hypothetical protein WH96_20195 [Kiloniella spongiae]|uniref:Glycosyl transferase family 1 domain-containing protein n=1 Tax=Kiloniella spongiae TaxID=1489064 RepID=A0A0H2M9H8_9PROT|nr:glycosyltransferase family 4 protein [Kiloniella spongiae]KLN58948.1 hypothetical protein WH96_20195 [Kiloniella spongiae]